MNNWVRKSYYIILFIIMEGLLLLITNSGWAVYFAKIENKTIPSWGISTVLLVCLTTVIGVYITRILVKDLKKEILIYLQEKAEQSYDNLQFHLQIQEGSLRNHLTAIRGFLYMEEYGELNKYIDQVCDQIQQGNVRNNNNILIMKTYFAKKAESRIFRKTKLNVIFNTTLENIGISSLELCDTTDALLEHSIFIYNKIEVLDIVFDEDLIYYYIRLNGSSRDELQNIPRDEEKFLETRLASKGLHIHRTIRDNHLEICLTMRKKTGTSM